MSENHQAILGRTMDFVYQLKGNPAVQPRHYYWESRIEYKGETLYGFVGSGSDMEGFYLEMVLMSMALAFQYNISEATLLTQMKLKQAI